jgi:hypothetical protein
MARQFRRTPAHQVLAVKFMQVCVNPRALRDQNHNVGEAKTHPR